MDSTDNLEKDLLHTLLSNSAQSMLINLKDLHGYNTTVLRALLVDLHTEMQHRLGENLRASPVYESSRLCVSPLSLSPPALIRQRAWSGPNGANPLRSIFDIDTHSLGSESCIAKTKTAALWPSVPSAESHSG